MRFERVLIRSTAFAVALGAGSAGAQEKPDLPPNAKPGECYARVAVPAEYNVQTEKVVKKPASQRIEIVPAKYEWVQERVLVKEASSKLVAVPATYENIKETIELEPARSVWRTGRTSKYRIADAGLVKAATQLGLPAAAAKPGDCFTERLVPERFETKEERVVARAKSSRIEIVPAKYEWAEEQVLMKEAGFKIVEVPAVYETVQEKVLVKPAGQEWKKGRGLREKVDHATGEIMCLVEVPAEYKTVTKRVMKTPATTKRVEIPAEYKTMKVRKLVTPATQKRIEIPAKYTTVTKRRKVSEAKRYWAPAGEKGDGKPTGAQLCRAEIPARTKVVAKRVEKTPATTRKETIPAEYRTLKVRKLVSKAQERRVDVPAEFESVERRKLVKEGYAAWRPVVCDTNAKPELIAKIQQALKTAGHDPGPIDGDAGSQTMAAIREFQQAKGLPTGGYTIATLRALGVEPQ